MKRKRIKIQWRYKDKEGVTVRDHYAFSAEWDEESGGWKIAWWNDDENLACNCCWGYWTQLAKYCLPCGHEFQILAIFDAETGEEIKLMNYGYGKKDIHKG